MKSMWPFESSSFSNSWGNIGNTSKEDMKQVMHCNMLYLFQALLYPKRKEKKYSTKNEKNKKG